MTPEKQKKQPEIEVKPLNLRRHSSKPVKRKVRMEHRQPIIGIPKMVLKQIGIVLNVDVKDLYVEFKDPNPLRGEVKIRFRSKRKLPEQLNKCDGQG